MAVVGVVVREEFVLRRHCDVEVVAGAGRIDLEVRAVGPHPGDAAAVDLDLVAVLAGGAIDALVAGADIEVAVHRDAAVRGDVVVEAGRGVRVRALDEVDAVLPHAVVVGEDAELRGVVDVDLAVQVLDPEDGVEAVGEDGDLAVGMHAEDAVPRLGGGTFHVHRVFPDEDPAVGREAEDGGVFDVGVLGDDLDLPVRGTLGRRLLDKDRQRGKDAQHGSLPPEPQ